MRIIILIVVFIVFLVSCQFDPGYQYFDKANLYYDDYSSIETYQDISIWINSKIYYKSETVDWWSSPQETVERGYGDCDDYARLFINIAYIVFGDKGNLVAIDASQRTIVDGGPVNHAIVEINGHLYEAQLGFEVYYPSIGYRYTFDELFYY